MPIVIAERLWILVVGIRPTIASKCGIESRGGVDILDASGIAGWRFGVGQLAGVVNGIGPEAETTFNWTLDELQADRQRWSYLEAYARTFSIAVGAMQAGAMNDDEVQRFWHGWQRNLAHAHGLLITNQLAVSACSVEKLDRVRSRIPTAAMTTGLVDHVSQICRTASAMVQKNVAEPPPLVLPEYRRVLAMALKRVAG